ncbi:MAG: hypothetical protein M3Y59_18450 [Myxococcota bacterium]|nr:hypothetical protein [Myxococcota bacterium]
MRPLESWFVEVDGRRFGASAPEFGDETLESRGGDLRLTFGVAANDVPELEPLIGRPARFVSSDDRDVAKLWVVKVDPVLNLVVCEVKEVSPLLGHGWWEESFTDVVT